MGIISRDPAVMNGEPVFAGTRVEVRTFVDHLKAGYSVDDFLDGSPTPGRAQAEGYLEITFEAAPGGTDARSLR